MQGRITKVLNMKPPEILSMLEEAAGTRMYETKKEAALKTLEKKQSKVDEIDKLLDQEILPALEKLRKERMQYMQWANGNAELDRLKEKIRDSAVSGVEQVKMKIADIEDSHKRMQVEIQEMETQVSNLTAEKEASMGERGIEDLKQSVEEGLCCQRAEDGAADLKQRVEELSKNLEECEKEYQGVLAGKSSGSEEKCLEDQLADAKVAVGSAETELKQLNTKITHSVSVENELNVRRKDVENIKMALESLTYKVRWKLYKDKVLSAQLGNVQFTYHDPVKNFDRSRVKGVVAKLIKVKDSSTMTALEVAAGGKLFNVVVDTENTGKLLLQNGDLRRRVTIIPLNKIQSHTVPLRVQKEASRLVGKENAELALSLVGYDEELKSAMEYVFGSTFVCKRIDAAKEVAFNRDISTPSVTLDGDIFQPSGLLTGGSRKGGGDLLRQLHALAEAESKLSTHQQKLSEIEAKIADLMPLQKRFMDLKARLELKSYDLSLFQNRAEQNEHHKLSELVKRIEQELGESKSAAREKQLLLENCINTVSLLEKSIKEHATNRAGRLKDLEKKAKALKSQMTSASRTSSVHLWSQLTCLRGQIDSLTSEVDQLKNKVPFNIYWNLSSDDPRQTIRRCHFLANNRYENNFDCFSSFQTNKSIIENDKSKIKMVIEELDEKKKETLKVTWTKVNKDFGSIFSTLLPGTMAKLEPPEGCSFLDGLEVRVAFGSVWKQSLSELSGGNVHCLLSLILALLLFKPAPLYILDEVLIQSHFETVSLHKEIFELANLSINSSLIKSYW
ncbi:hypothetical protein AAG906_025808 [Vitis piasezkii]